jgi:hypothetical protein
MLQKVSTIRTESKSSRTQRLVVNAPPSPGTVAIAVKGEHQCVVQCLQPSAMSHLFARFDDEPINYFFSSEIFILHPSTLFSEQKKNKIPERLLEILTSRQSRRDSSSVIISF